MSTDLLIHPPDLPDAEPEAETDAEPDFSTAERLVTLAFVVLPAVAVVLAAVRFWGHGIHLRDLALAFGLYLFVGYGITIGFHRMLTHRSFRPSRPLKVIMAIAGSMAFQGGPIGWVADHRRHHVFSDRPGDPHSPYFDDDGRISRLRGLAHAHLGWLFSHSRTPSGNTRDLQADRDIVWIDRLFPLWCTLSLAVPFACGYLVGGGIGAALTALLWAGGVRIFVQHHVTWSVNSLCHAVGKRPFATRDRSTNFAALAVPTFGESWHNAHHAFPRSARHGLLPSQSDPSAWLIQWFERLGWATEVVRPTTQQIRAALSSPD